VQRRVLIHGARQLLTLRGSSGPKRGADLSQLHVIEDGAVLIEDGTIVEVGLSRRLENLTAAKRARVIAANGCVVMPAFVDSGTESLRAPMTGHQAATAPRLRREGESTLAGMLQHGTATVETKGSDVRSLRIISQMESPIEIIPTLEVGASVTDELLSTVRRRGMARFVQARIRGDEAFDKAALDAIRRARTYGFDVRVAAGDTGPANRYFQDALDSELQAAIHLNGIRDSEIAALALSHTVAVLAPGTVFHQGTGPYPPARSLIDRGAAIALATGYGPATNPSYSMGVALSLACRKMALSPAEAVAAATINAAHALGIGSRAGSLEAGKQADILILNAHDYRALAWEFGINLVGLVMKNGEIVYDAGRPRWPDN
jgi:imidazolonepropionase